MNMVPTRFNACNTLPPEEANFGFEARCKPLGRPSGKVALPEEIWQE